MTYQPRPPRHSAILGEEFDMNADSICQCCSCRRCVTTAVETGCTHDQALDRVHLAKGSSRIHTTLIQHVRFNNIKHNNHVTHITCMSCDPHHVMWHRSPVRGVVTDVRIKPSITGEPTRHDKLVVGVVLALAMCLTHVNTQKRAATARKRC